MIEDVIFSLEMPYRDPLEIRAFSFGTTSSGRTLTRSVSMASMQRSLFLVAGLRGDEIQQTLVLSLMVERLRKMEKDRLLVPGHLTTVVSCANPASMGIGRRFWPGDRTDINRMFPGSRDGETTERIAAALLEASDGYHYGVHLSSFYLEGDFLPHVRVMHGPGNDRNHGADFGLPLVTHYQPGSFDTATLHYNWRHRGTEAYSFYTEQTLVANEEAAQEAVRSLVRFMTARGLAKADFFGGHRCVELEERLLVPVTVPVGGVFCPQVEVGALVEKGRSLAYVRDLLRGSTIAKVPTPLDGVVFYRARTPLVNERTMAFQIVPPVKAPDT